VSFDVARRGFRDDRTSFAQGHLAYRGARTDGDARDWLFADVNSLAQDPASPHPREGIALSAAVPLDANHNPAGAFADDTRVSFALGRERAISPNARWTASGSYSHSGQRQFRGFLSEIADAPDNATGFREDIDVNDVYADAHVTWSRSPRLKVLAGGDLLFGNGEGRGATFRYTVPLSGVTATAVSEPSALNLDAESRRTFVGGYTSAEWTPVSRLHLSAGVRLNATRERRGEGASVTHVRPAGSLGIMVPVFERGTDHVRLFANYRDTFKPAAFDFSLAENEGVLDPETSRSYEGGVKARTAHGRIDIEGSLFRMDFRNLVTSTVLEGLPSLQNAGSTRFHGFEVASTLRGPGAWSGRTSYSFHDSTFVDFVQAFDGVDTQLAGNRFEMSPRHLFSAGIMRAPARGIVVQLAVKYSGDRALNKRNTAIAPGFATVDAGIGYRLERWELRVDGRNLSDRRDPIAESELGDAQYYRLPSRRIDATVGVRF
jgi:iron complex outermembrane receptor protein